MQGKTHTSYEINENPKDHLRTSKFLDRGNVWSFGDSPSPRLKGIVKIYNNNAIYYRRGRSKKKVIKEIDGKKIRVLKNLPKGCKMPKRICIECLKNVIRKNDLNYELKVCKECMGNRVQY